MARTSPPLPFDIAELFPELLEHRTTTTRLHPRTGSPTSADSSIGGPLLWPAGEPWPMCADGPDHFILSDLLTPAAVRRGRQIRASAAGRSFTTAEGAELRELDDSEPEELIHEPVPMIPVMQLYRRDVPGFIGPGDSDLLQVLWCPLTHEEEMAPRLRLFWRRAADVGRPLTTSPEPVVVEEDYLPNPCVVHPERVVDHRYRELLPKPLQARIEAWEKATDGPGYGIWTVPGWKLGGFPSWQLTGPGSRTCDRCGTEMDLLFTVGVKGEWFTGGYWLPIEESDGVTDRMTEINISRGYDWNVFHCPVSFDHPPSTQMS